MAPSKTSFPSAITRTSAGLLALTLSVRGLAEAARFASADETAAAFEDRACNRALIFATANHPPAISAAATKRITAKSIAIGRQSRGISFSAFDPVCDAPLPFVSSEYSATMLSSSRPRYLDADRMKPRLNAPPGSWSHCPLSIASRNLVLMRVAEETSSRETPRISRSRFKCSPKGEVDAIRWNPQPMKNIGAGPTRVNECRAISTTVRRPSRRPDCQASGIGLSAIGPRSTVAERKSRSL